MTIRKYPSTEFPGFPEIEIACDNERWKGVDIPETVMGFVTKEIDGFAPNIVITVKKVDLAFDFDVVSSELAETTKDYKGLNIFSNEVHEINGRQWLVEEFAYVNEDIGPLAQILAFTFVDNENSRFLISFTGTTTIRSEQENESYAEMQNILRSAKVSQ